MDELIKRLELRLISLLGRLNQLECANHELQQNETLLTREKDLLIVKNKSAIQQIERMVSRLKLIEKQA